jgi:hypothetical protein
MDDDLPPLKPNGQPPNAPRNARGQYLPGPGITKQKARNGNGRTYIVRRLSRDGRFDLVAMVRERKISAAAAARRGGFGYRKPQSKSLKPPRLDVKALIG